MIWDEVLSIQSFRFSHPIFQVLSHFQSRIKLSVNSSNFTMTPLHKTWSESSFRRTKSTSRKFSKSTRKHRTVIFFVTVTSCTYSSEKSKTNMVKSISRRRHYSCCRHCIKSLSTRDLVTCNKSARSLRMYQIILTRLSRTGNSSLKVRSLSSRMISSSIKRQSRKFFTSRLKCSKISVHEKARISPIRTSKIKSS